MIIREELKYPCGVERNFYFKGTVIDGKIETDKIPICPIHGKKCKKGD